MINLELLNVLEILVSAALQFFTTKDYCGLSPLDYAMEAKVDLFVQIYLKQQMKGLDKLGSKDLEGLKNQHTTIPATPQANTNRRPKKEGAMAA